MVHTCLGGALPISRATRLKVDNRCNIPTRASDSRFSCVAAVALRSVAKAPGVKMVLAQPVRTLPVALLPWLEHGARRPLDRHCRLGRVGGGGTTAGARVQFKGGGIRTVSVQCRSQWQLVLLYTGVQCHVKIWCWHTRHYAFLGGLARRWHRGTPLW